MHITKMVTAAVIVAIGLFGMGIAMGADEERTTSGSTVIHPDRWPALSSPVLLDLKMESAIDELLARMTVEEKVGQVIQGEIRHVTPADVRAYHLGSVLNGGGSHPGNAKHTDPEDWLVLADTYWEASMDTSDGAAAIPIIWGTDAVHGHTNVVGATVFPHNIGLGAARDPELIRRIGEVTAAEIAVTGLDWDFGPVVAVVRDDRWGRTYESYSEDPGIVRAYATEMVKGLQGVAGTPGFLDGRRVVACAKHFLGDGGTAGGKDQGDNHSSEAELRDIHGAGYFSAIEAGVQTVMASFSSWRGRKIHGSSELLTDVLKERMGFDGFVVGDWNAHGQVDGCANDSCAAAFNAGVDLFMAPEDWKALWENTVVQVRSGEISMERLNDAVRRILRVKMRAGLFERGKPSDRPSAGDLELFGSPEHRAVAREAVRESLVLLKNNGGLLPLRRDQRVLVAGDGADDIGKQSGGWTISWQGDDNENVDFPGATSIWDGIRAAVESGGGVAVLSADGSFKQNPDVAIVVFGEDPYAEFQGDRDTLEYGYSRPDDVKLLKKLQAAGIPVVSIFLSGRPLWVNPELNASDAFIAAWLPGSEAGGVADVIFRAADGSIAHDLRGKLPFSWPRTAIQTPLNIGDEGYDPLFPFGFGLTYSDRWDLRELPEETGIVGSSASRTVYFKGGPVAPWKLFVGDGVDWAVPVAGSRTTTRHSDNLMVTAVDRQMQEDARLVRWSGESVAMVYLRADEAIDLTREANGGIALVFDVLVEEPPASSVMLGMICGDECGSRMDITGLLGSSPVGEWQTLTIRLSCFADVAVDLAHVTTPFLIATDGELTLRFADVRLESAAEGEVPCP
ncbi:MAG: exo 1,3/1,4-beta-D-glucan glucohydrolase [Acidobacteria bacterium]|nr:exo 1,3/1,4-beta-D-glucan glucohydrolase [Candidatus Sulfomarinibacter sp. MAG AM1]